MLEQEFYNDFNIISKYNFCIFTAVGCPDMTAPVHGWFKRTEDGASVGCTHTDEEWHLRCSGSSWIGQMGNCSASEKDIPVQIY